MHVQTDTHNLTARRFIYKTSSKNVGLHCINFISKIFLNKS